MFNINFDNIKPAELSVKTTKTKYTAKQVVEYMKSNGKWQQWLDACSGKAVRAAASIKKLVMRKKCHSCDGSGKYVGTTYTRECFTCKGKGHMDESDIRRFEAWAAARKSGKSKVTYNDHNNSSWSFA